MINFKTKEKEFVKALQKIDLSKIEALPYPLQYAKHTLQHKAYYASIYTKCLQLLYKDTNEFENDIIIDFGCGNGFLALFLAFCGCQNVIAVEVREEFIAVAHQLQTTLDLEGITWLVGNEQTLVSHFSHKPTPQTLIATDVIEHIYNLPKFFLCLRQLQLNKLAFTTGSVHDNYFKRKQLYRLMDKDEYIANTALHVSVNSEYGSLPYMQVREKLIQKHYPKLLEEQTKLLAIATRGMYLPDIIKEVDKYLYTQKLPRPINHAHNTCDPLTGSFTERMLTIKEYRALFTQIGFELTITNGNYNSNGLGVKQLILKMTNGFINLFPNNYIGRFISPSIYLVGDFEMK